jgi:putative peptidoglycan lipid II flippase
MRKRVKRLNGRDIFLSFMKIAAASSVLSAVCYTSYRFLINQFGAATLTLRLIDAFVPIALGGIAFVVVAKLLRVTELEQAIGTIRRKIRK